MKAKILAGLYLLILVIGTVLSLYIPKNEVTANEALVIPNEAIRLRILANSDSEKDQAVKRKVRDEVNQAITVWVSELTSLEAARDTIRGNLPKIEEIAKRILKEEGLHYSVNVDFEEVQFPTKLYGDFLYSAGTYEAVLITLGEGSGANWWCVLFPPLCFVDFSNGIATSPGFEENGKKVEAASDEDKAEEESEKANVVKTVEVADKDSKSDSEPLYVEEKEEEVEFRFFLVDFFKSIF
ncbi:stage II sporulation protein R [Bacillus oleivorans]|uniref:Stage II sporulation protein R n=1 Tax=Bacillus oleivorans TaxID=1448271 RepID=A0A285CH88_9BACI|nr:stage II sporulation protein R [Bacillus oleivorans]SNX66954.1 stage II sporulation protein R [Bacillus oleivorans]